MMVTVTVMSLVLALTNSPSGTIKFNPVNVLLAPLNNLGLTIPLVIVVVSGSVASYTSTSAESILLVKSGTTSYKGHITSMDIDGFTITWTKTGTPTAILQVRFLAFG